MTKKSLLIIAPAYPPKIDGIGAYASNLGKSISEDGCQVYYYQKNDFIYNYFKIFTNDLDISKFCAEKNIQTLILNYSGYGFNRKGVPLMLLITLWRLKRANGIQLITFFHEIYAIGSIFTSAFWLHLFQRLIFRSLLTITDSAICSNQRVLDLIVKEKILKRDQMYRMPIFSNIGELGNRSITKSETDCLLIFGTEGLRRKVYESESFKNFIETNNFKKVIDIGPGIIAFSSYGNIPLERLGILSESKIAEILAKTLWVAISYPQSLLAKSGVFAAYAAHACCVVNFDSANDECFHDGLKCGLHYVTPMMTIKKDDTSSMGSLLYDWYQEHNIKKHKELFSQIIN